MDEVNRSILDCLQADFPLEIDPWQSIAASLGIETVDLLTRLDALMKQGYLSFIGPIFDPRKLGYRTSLVAVETAKSRIDGLARIASSYPGVSHCYARNGELNLWFTLAVPSDTTLSSVIRRMFQGKVVDRVLLLPQVKRFKLRVRFGVGHHCNTWKEDENSNNAVCQDNKKLAMSKDDLFLVRSLGCGLKPVEHPWSACVGHQRGAAEILMWLKRQLASGAIRRVSGLVRHTKVGYSFNAMVVWCVPFHHACEVGHDLANHSMVSHCYQRRSHSSWPYTHYAMIHAPSESCLYQIIEELNSRVRFSSGVVLRTVKEYKKERLMFDRNEYLAWHPPR